MSLWFLFIHFSTSFMFYLLLFGSFYLCFQKPHKGNIDLRSSNWEGMAFSFDDRPFKDTTQLFLLSRRLPGFPNTMVKWNSSSVLLNALHRNDRKVRKWPRPSGSILFLASIMLEIIFFFFLAFKMYSGPSPQAWSSWQQGIPANNSWYIQITDHARCVTGSD